MVRIKQGAEVEQEIKDKFRRLVEEHFLQRVVPCSSANATPPASMTAEERFQLPPNLGMPFAAVTKCIVECNQSSSSYLLSLSPSIQILYPLERREVVHLMQQSQSPRELRGLCSKSGFE